METKENENCINHKTKQEEDRMKDLLIRHHSVTSIDSKKIDISKLVNDYQQRFSVPKALIIKWLNIKNQKSQFGTSQGNSNPTGSIDNSCLSDDSISSASSYSNKSEKNVSKKLIEELVKELDEDSDESDQPCKFTKKKVDYSNESIDGSSCDQKDVERDRSVSLPKIENRSIDEVIDITRGLDPIMKTIDNRVQSKADLKIESFGSGLLGNINEQKNSKPNFVIKRRNITKEKEKIGSKLAILTYRAKNIIDLSDNHDQNKNINPSDLLHPIKLELKNISNNHRNVTPVMQRRSLQLSAEKKKIKRKTSHNQLQFERVNGVNEKRYESQRMSYNGPLDILKSHNMNVNLKKMAPILPPLVKRDLPVNAAWNHLLNHNLLTTFTPNSLTNKAANLFSSRLEAQTWRFGKNAASKELDRTHNSSSREVSLEEIDEKRAGISNRYINLRKSFKGTKFGNEIKVVGKKSTFKVLRSISRERALQREN